MKIIIEIPEEAVKTDNIANDFITYFECCTPKLFETLKNGTPLPEQHGRLIDADKLESIEIKYKEPQESEPKTGHWIGHREHCENLGVMPSGLGAYNWCSNCDCGIDVKEFHRNHYNFCPNCGADMRESEE